MTTKREMLEFAAKACGITLDFTVRGDFPPYYINERGGHSSWNPLTNNSDCAAMCAKLDINTFWWATGEVECVSVSEYEDNYIEKHDGTDTGKEAAWRYAATQVAAKIGGMK
jgi:hypothetical protein